MFDALNEQMVTHAAIALLILALGLSFLRHKVLRRKGAEQPEQPQNSVSIRETFAEVREYFDLPSSRIERDGVANAFDLTAFEMTADVTSSIASGKKKAGKARKKASKK